MFCNQTSPSRTFLVIRGTLVVGALLAGSVGVGRLALPHLPYLPRPAATPGAVEPGGLPDLVAAGCAAALLACWGWVLLGAVHVLAVACRDHLAGPSRGRSPRPAWPGTAPGPRLVRVLVWALLGLGYAAPPALAGGTADPGCDYRAVPADLSGLSLPQLPTTPHRDRTAGAAPAQPGTTRAHGPAQRPAQRPVREVRLRPGDSLWAVAERLLPPGAGDRLIDRGWRRIARTNPRVVGADPDLVFPGTVLRVPVPLNTDGKDRP